MILAAGESRERRRVAAWRGGTTRAALLAAALLTTLWLAPAAPASASLEFDRFVTHGEARARWIEEPSAPAGARERQSIELFVNGTSSQDFDDAARVLFKGFAGAPPATPPGFFYKVLRPGPSGGSVRLAMRFSDGGFGYLRPVTLLGGQWVRADGAAADWDSRGGAGCASPVNQTYGEMLACHRGASVTRVELINDSGWLHSGGFGVLVDDVSYGGATVSAPPPPVLGRRVNLTGVSGRVFVSVPRGSDESTRRLRGLKGSRRFVVLRDLRQLPVGSFVDARAGSVRLVTARNRRGRTQAGHFTAGVFQTLQSRRRRARGLTEVRLKGSSFRRCGRSGHASSARAQLSRHSRRGVRRLRGRATGRFRIRGRYASATVRGTVWTVTDRCDGTLTRVRRGKVAVRDFRRKRIVTVRAGKSYLARAPG